MKILFLTNNEVTERLVDWLKDDAKEEVEICREEITEELIKYSKPDFLVSYNYKHIIKKDVLDLFKHRAINLHISLLPWNRGADPNLWSFIEDTPKGVTIHYIDEGIDTGDIIVQKEVYIDEDKETLKTSYEILHREIQALFKENWNKIKNSEINTITQVGGGVHYKRESIKFESFIKEKGWNTLIRELKEQYNRGRDKP